MKHKKEYRKLFKKSFYFSSYSKQYYRWWFFINSNNSVVCFSTIHVVSPIFLITIYESLLKMSWKVPHTRHFSILYYYCQLILPMCEDLLYHLLKCFVRVNCHCHYWYYPLYMKVGTIECPLLLLRIRRHFIFCIYLGSKIYILYFIRNGTT